MTALYIIAIAINAIASGACIVLSCRAVRREAQARHLIGKLQVEARIWAEKNLK